jgi:hypothetical protein
MSCHCDEHDGGFTRVATLTAAKEHACCECGELIQKGDQYLDIVHLFEAEWSHYPTCECCKLDWEQLLELGHCWVVGHLDDSLQEAYK